MPFMRLYLALLKMMSEVLYMISLIALIVFTLGSVQLFKEYHYLLDYKRDERTFNEYRERSKDELEEIYKADTFDF